MQAITDIIVNERNFPTNLQISNNITNSQQTSSFSFEDVLSFVKNEMPKTDNTIKTIFDLADFDLTDDKFNEFETKKFKNLSYYFKRNR